MYKIVEQKLVDKEHYLVLQLGDDTSKRLVVLVPLEDNRHPTFKYLYSRPQEAYYPIYGLNFTGPHHVRM